MGYDLWGLFAAVRLAHMGLTTDCAACLFATYVLLSVYVPYDGRLLSNSAVFSVVWHTAVNSLSWARRSCVISQGGDLCLTRDNGKQRMQSGQCVLIYLMYNIQRWSGLLRVDAHHECGGTSAASTIHVDTLLRLCSFYQVDDSIIIIVYLDNYSMWHNKLDTRRDLCDTMVMATRIKHRYVYTNKITVY